jgi:hypothetical protein
MLLGTFNFCLYQCRVYPTIHDIQIIFYCLELIALPLMLYTISEISRLSVTSGCASVQ